jgi:cyanamide hydratase
MSTSNEDGELLVSRWIAVPRSFTKSIGDVDTNKHGELAVDGVKSPESEIAKEGVCFLQRNSCRSK